MISRHRKHLKPVFKKKLIYLKTAFILLAALLDCGVCLNKPLVMYIIEHWVYFVYSEQKERKYKKNVIHVLKNIRLTYRY